jgi:serine/threonine protein phosphatase PrpC
MLLCGKIKINMATYHYGFKSDIGRRRSQNQDAGGAYSPLGLFLVSDGMGGHRGGEIASKVSVETIHSYIQKHSQIIPIDPKNILIHAIESANQEIYRISQDDSKLQGMGTTTTALLFHDNLLTIGQVGDSRCYLIRPECIWQLTRDHSLVQEKLRAGLIKRETLKTDKMRNVITRSVGFESEVNVEVFQMKVQKKDCFLICSDGLSGMLEDTEILKLVETHLFDSQVNSQVNSQAHSPESPHVENQGSQEEPMNGTSNASPKLQKVVEQLILAANDHGGDDNITSLLIQVN